MAHSSETPSIPPAALWAIGGLMALSMAVAALGRYGEIGTVRPPAVSGAPTAAAPAADRTRLLRFEPLPSEAIRIYDAANGDRFLGEIAPGHDNFVRHMLRGLDRDRIAHGVALSEPYQVLGWNTGRYAILDPATGRRIELNGFGATNTEAVARLFTVGKNSP